MQERACYANQGPILLTYFQGERRVRMIVERMAHSCKVGCRNKMLEVLQEMWKTWDDPPTHRIYLPISGEAHVVYQEIEFEDFQAREEFWAKAWATPERRALGGKWVEVADVSSPHEFVRLVE